MTMKSTQTPDETKIAQEIVGVLPEGIVARVCSDDRQSIRFAVRSKDLKLRTIVLRRTSLRRLASDPMREIKIEYLRRDLSAAAESRREFRYPHSDFAARKIAVTRVLQALAR